ncbi:translation termination factor GTPase eRF3 [Bacidia gigantensis]|uniref:translation termination factor GTPase eRF3 n=1 Tax=Bacidia gigantensis TaxID=2732470 RepID=UPI001D05880D|nr:translation termination factor GTPase eRF3 [Bacidia gigantensis]KAG8532900.1 translation termination factor GTPase eRF3 [Bacidia gigantensis]
MSGLDSWEDDPSAQDEGLAHQAQQNLNINGQPRGPPGFSANAHTFQPGASSFQPGQPYQQYGGYNPSQQYNQAYDQQSQLYGGQYKQYGQQSLGQYNQSYSQQGQLPQQSVPQRTPIIAKRPTNDNASAAAAAPPSQSAQSGPPPVKSLSIGKEEATTAPKTKVLSIGVPTPAVPASKPDATAEEGAKTTAAKALDKTQKQGTTSDGKTSPSPSSGRSSPSAAEAKEVKDSKESKDARREADAVAKEQAAAVDEEMLEEVYGKEHVNVIFIGHVDAGKSTLGGSILQATGMVDERTMDKYKRDAKDAGKESWYLSWVMDLNKEERSKGKTIEVGKGFFETDKRRYSILDAPGHKNYVPNMLLGASQADVGILVISARKGEYETGFERGGQTREHAILAKTQGVNKLLIVVNKMDDPTVEWSQDRYKECTEKLTTFLNRQVGFSKGDLTFMPISAQSTIGIKDRIPKKTAPWWDGPSLLEYLDNLKSLERKVQAPFMMPINGKYRDLGTMIEGKIEAGQLKKDSKYLMMPNREEISISALYGETEDEIPAATCGDQVRLRVRGVEEEDILPGFVLCAPKRPVHCVNAFEAQIALLELKSILSAGFNCVLHVHSAIEEVTFAALLHKLEKGTGRKSKKPPPFGKQGMNIIARLEVTSGAGKICVERYEDYAQMGRFTLRDQGQTIAIGKITKLITDTA